MNSNQTTLLITSILAFALLANVNVGAVFATGGLDDEEEEEAIEQLQNAIEDINGKLGTIELNLTAGANDIQANCPSVEEVVEEVVENITNNNNNVTEPEQPAAECNPVVPEEPVQQPPTTVIPPVQNNVTEGCNPIPEPEPEQNETQSELEPIICPVNGELLGYTNTTSGEQLPISAGNGTSFIPIIDIPVVEEPEQNNQTVTEQAPQCNVTQQQPVQNQTTAIPAEQIQDEQEIATIEFEASCGCFVVDKSPEEVQ
jgi:hypothetical protein